ncbi:MAG: aminoglycoside phosphotransferase family protein [Chloroflexota bacterium]|nr:aminoglycoside phosphotransferase family protein [Chloroflexota bacterium]
MNAYAERLGHVAPEKLQAALDRFDLGRLVSTTPVTTGNFGQNVFLTTTTGEYVFRGNPFFEWQLPKEREVAQILHDRTTVPVPWPYHHEPSTDLFGWDYAIMPRLSGEMVNDAPAPDQVTLARTMGEILARFQGATFDRAMAFDLAAGGFVALPNGERANLASHIRRNLDLSVTASACTSDADATWVRSLVTATERSTTEWTPSCLVHGDFTINNVVAEHGPDGWRITGVFDFMTARIGSFEADLCRQFALHHERTPAVGIAFLEAYFALCPPRSGYRHRLPLLLLDERLTLWEWIQRTQPDWWTFDIGLRDWAEPVLDALLAYG